MSSFKANRQIGRNRKQTGQGMTEYIIIVALIAIGAIGVYSSFGRTVQSQMAAVSNGLAGQAALGQADMTQAATTAARATNDSQQVLGLDTYTTVTRNGDQ